jgi:hypothetical protein
MGSSRVNIVARSMHSMHLRGFPRDLTFLAEQMAPLEYAIAFVRAIEYCLGPSEESGA